MRGNKDLRIILPVSAAVLLLSYFLGGTTSLDHFPDSLTYIRAWESISNGEIDILRTPIYPCYLGLTIFLFGFDHFINAAVFGQYLVYFLSVLAFHNICRHFFTSPKIVFWITLLYSVNPYLYSWCTCILTESFAICGTVFIISCLLHLYDRFSWIWSVFFTLLQLFLLLLRPSFIYIVPILFVAWLFLASKRVNKLQVIAGLSSTSLSLMILFAYMSLYKQHYGIYSTSCVGTFNRWSISLYYDLLNPSVINNPELRQDIINLKRDVIREQSYETPSVKEFGDLINLFVSKYSLKDRNDALNASLCSHPLKNFNAAIDRARRASYKPVFFTYAPSFGNFIEMITEIRISLSSLYIFLFIYLVIGFLKIKNNQHMPRLSIILWFFVIGNFAVAIAGAQDEWNRLVVPSYPVLLIMLGQLCTLLSFKPLSCLDLR